MADETPSTPGDDTDRQSRNTTRKKPEKKKASVRKKTSTRKPAEAPSSAGKSSAAGAAATPDEVVAAKTARNETAAQPATSGNTVAWIALVAGLAGLGFGAYTWYITEIESKVGAGQQLNRFATLEQQIEGFDDGQAGVRAEINQIRGQLTQSESDINSRIRGVRAELDAQDADVRKQIAESRASLDGGLDSFRKDFEALAGSIVKLRADLARGIDSWTLEEVEQLLFIANQKVLLDEDAGLAAEALKLADDRLATLSDPRLVETRTFIARDLAALEAVQPVDTNGVISQLAAAADVARTLALAGDLEIPEKAVPGQSGSDESGGASAADDPENESAIEEFTRPIVETGARLLADIGDMIQVEKSGESLRPVISAEARQLTYDKFDLIMDSAQIAFLRSQQIVFQARIDAAISWLNERFDMSSPQAVTLLTSLSDIRNAPSRPQMPDVSASLDALRDVMAQSQ